MQKQIQLRFGGTVIRMDRKRLIVLISILVVTLFFLVYFIGPAVFEQDDPDLPVATPIHLALAKKTDKQKLVEPALKHQEPKAEKFNVPRMDKFDSAMGIVPPQLLKQRQEAAKGLMQPNRPPDEKYNINVTISDWTSLERPLPDTRPPVCATIKYDISAFNKVSVIIPFFNEAPTMLLRAIHSVLIRTHASLLEEIILVDDLSYDEPLKTPLENYVKLLPNVKLVRHNKRSGLIVARMIGARLAKAPTIVFLDAHTEVNEGWLEPMLEELRRSKQQIVQPFIDGVDKNTLEYTAPGIYFKGSLSWDLRYTWLKLADHEQERSHNTGHAFFSPTLVGCAITLDKDYFLSTGAFDEGLKVWGGENLELAFKTWMCGGKVVTSPCSRVGHVFKQSPNKFDGTIGTKEETVQRNLMRVADVWMDGMRKFFYATSLAYEYKRLKYTQEDLVSLEQRRRLRRSLKCRNFEWYLHNVAPEMEETPPMESKYFGEIMNLHTRACWEITDDYYMGMTYFCFEHKVMPKNYFSITAEGFMRYRDKCVQVIPPRPYLIVSECPPRGSDPEAFGVWEMVNKGISWGWLRVKKRNEKGQLIFWCINQVTNAMPEHRGEQMPQLGSCDEKDPFLLWSFTYAVDFSLVPQYVPEMLPNRT